MARFIDVDNMRTVLAELAARLAQSPHDMRAVVARTAPLKDVTFDTMVQMAQDPAFEGLSLPQMNQIVVQTCVDYYVASAATLAKQRQEEAESQRSSVKGVQRRSNMVREGDLILPATDLPQNMPVANSSSQILSTDQGNRPEVTIKPTPSSADGTESVVRRGISIDGQDRNRTLMPMRYDFTSYLSEPLRNIKEIRTTSVVIPIQDHTVNCPHLLLMIEEIAGPFQHSSNDATRRAFSKMVPKATYKGVQHAATAGEEVFPPSGRSYAILEPIPDIATVFSPPLSSLARLSVRLTRPNGVPISTAKDTHQVVKVTEANDENWMITTQSRWRRQEFARGDIVVMSACSTGVKAFDQHINRSGGHVILASGGAENAVADEGCNTIIIRCPGDVDADGAFIVDKEAIIAFSDNSGLSEVAIATPADIINASLQMSITLEASCVQSKVPGPLTD
jgi:hypothetical protein